jgi:NifU-like protein
MASPSEDTVVCRCFVVPGEAIRRAIQEHDLHQVEEVTACTRAGGGCSSCWDDIQAILSSVRGQPPRRDAPDASGLSSAQKRALIVKALDEHVFPLFDANHLQLQLVDVVGDRVLVRFTGDRVGTTVPSYLALKRFLVQKLTDACGQKMNVIELNVLEGLAKSAR